MKVGPGSQAQPPWACSWKHAWLLLGPRDAGHGGRARGAGTLAAVAAGDLGADKGNDTRDFVAELALGATR